MARWCNNYQARSSALRQCFATIQLHGRSPHARSSCRPRCPPRFVHPDGPSNVQAIAKHVLGDLPFRSAQGVDLLQSLAEHVVRQTAVSVFSRKCLKTPFRCLASDSVVLDRELAICARGCLFWQHRRAPPSAAGKTRGPHRCLTLQTDISLVHLKTVSGKLPLHFAAEVGTVR
jgi:hypothetical protein